MNGDKKKFLQFEAHENLFEHTYNGIPYWEMLRFSVCQSVYSDYSKQENSVRIKLWKRKQIQMVFRAFLFAIRSEWNMKDISYYDVIRFYDSTRHNPKSKFLSYWKMPENITVLDIKSSISIEDILPNDKRNLMLPYIKAKSKYYFAKIFGLQKYDVDEQKFLKNLEKKIQDEFGQSPSAEQMEKEIVNYLYFNHEFELFFERLFAKTKCKALVVVPYYENHLYSAYRVARKYGIRVIELQHGVVNNHQEYWFEDQRGINNYTPDYFLAFGDAHIAWTKMLSNTRAISVGFPYQDEQIKKVKDLKTEEKTIIIYPTPWTEFERTIDEFANCAIKKGYRIIVKLHSLQAVDYKKCFPLLSQNCNLEIVSTQTEGIYYWLKLGKHHVMADTTVGLEAIVMKHANICIATHVPHMQTQPLLDWGVARGFSTAEELWELIKKPMEHDTKQIKEKLWMPYGKQNIEAFFLNMKKQNWPAPEDYDFYETDAGHLVRSAEKDI